jgi:hypothetical protein
LGINTARHFHPIPGALLLILALVLGAASGHATQQQVVFQITNKVIQNGATVSGSSASLLPAAAAYSYSISGSCYATGDLSDLISGTESIADAIDQLDPGASPPASSFLQGTVVNPGGAIPFTVLDKTLAGSFADGLASGTIDIQVYVDATGRANFLVNNIDFETIFGPDSSQLVIESATVTTTAVLTPVTATGTATSVTGSSATLNATVNPNGDNATVTFEYGLDSTYGTTTSPQIVPLGLSAAPVAAGISALVSGTTYHYRVDAVNSTGTSTGADSTFVTPAIAGEAPTATTGTATGIGMNGATVNGLVNPNGSDTSVTFEYGLTASYTGTTPAQDIGSGSSPVAVNALLGNLTPGMIYHYQVTGSNAQGVTSGGDQMFTTTTSIAAPAATTGSATAIGTTGATLNALVNPNGADTTVTFAYGLTASYTGTTTAQDIGDGTSAVAVNALIGDLTPNMLYHFQVTGSNSQGITPGGDLTFMTSDTTAALAPTVTTGAATAIGISTATLNGSVNPNGATTTAYFEYGTDTNYGTTTTPVSIGAESTAIQTSTDLTGLLAGTTYHYAAVGVNVTGTAVGPDQTFTTGFLFPQVAGKYVAAITGTSNATSGLVTVTLTSKGSFTSALDLAGKTTSFSGKFVTSGTASAAKSGYTIQLQLGKLDGVNSVTGAVTGPATFDFAAAQSLVEKATPLKYTVRIPAPTDVNLGLPAGNGYAAMTVSKTGAIHLAGELGDGTPFSASAGLLANGTWALYTPLYKKQGCVVGTITFETTPNGDFDGPVTWFKPATTGTYTPGAFTANVNLYGSLYTKPMSGTPVISSTTGDIDFEGASPILEIQDPVVLTSANKFTFPQMPTDDLKLTVSTSTGLFGGSFKDPDGKTRKFNGAVFQDSLNFGSGVFKGTTEAGSVELFPPVIIAPSLEKP